MSEAKYEAQVSRDAILNLLTDVEVARVSNAEGARALSDGAEYLDLEHLDRGVQKAKADTRMEMGHVLPRSAVSTETWKKIIAPFAT